MRDALLIRNGQRGPSLSSGEAEGEHWKALAFCQQPSSKRPAQPEEIAPAYVFLASPQCSSYITGEILPIIGGY